MRTIACLCVALLMLACAGEGRSEASIVSNTLPSPTEQAAGPLPRYEPRHGRARPVIAIVAENHYTELTDYVVPYGVLSAADVADVLAVATKAEPVRMFPAPMRIEPQATTAVFDGRYPEGADYVIVPAVHRDDDATLLAWVRAQAAKGATVVGVCDGVWVLARAGLLEGRAATGHWYSRDDLRSKFPGVRWQTGQRYIADGKVVTTTGVTATIPVSLALIEAIAGHERAARVSASLGGPSNWSPEHPSERFKLDNGHRYTVARNMLAFWRHEDLGTTLAQGIDEIALALQAEVYSATYRSTVYTVATDARPVKTRRGLTVLPDRTEAKGLRMLPSLSAEQPLGTLDRTLKSLANDYGDRTAAFVALQMEYPGY